MRKTMSSSILYMKNKKPSGPADKYVLYGNLKTLKFFSKNPLNFIANIPTKFNPPKQNIKKMTEKQFQEAVAINKRIVALEESLHKICSNDNLILYYIYKNCNRDYSLHPSWVINPLSSLLAKHDAMIREEIKQEIEALKKKIEAL